MITAEIIPSEEKNPSGGSLIDYLASIPGREVSKEARIANTAACHDADYIPKVKNAGQVVAKEHGKYQLMHNGLKVSVDGYYGAWVTQSIIELKGHHEPQEEKVFYEVSKRFRPSTWMIELGAYWAFYSLWFHKATENAHNICCEPDPENLKIGKKNVNLNGFDNFHHIMSAAGSEDGKTISFDAENVDEKVIVPIRSVDSIVEEFHIKKLEVLHMDVQGAELDSLKGAIETIKQGKLRFIFISTHHYLISRNPNIHQDCLDFIMENGGHIICEHDIHESYSGDGLIVASFLAEDKDFKVEVSRHRMAANQFRAYTSDLSYSIEAYDYLLDRISAKNKLITAYEMQIKNLKRDIDHLNTLPIKLSLQELGKSVKRSAKFRVTRAVWGEKHFYQSNEKLHELAGSDIGSRAAAVSAVRSIAENDAANLCQLLKSPPLWRVKVYEALRRGSHIPRKIAGNIKGASK